MMMRSHGSIKPRGTEEWKGKGGGRAMSRSSQVEREGGKRGGGGGMVSGLTLFERGGSLESLVD